MDKFDLEDHIKKVCADFDKKEAADDMYDALWAAVELSDRTLPKSGRTPECQRVYDQCVAALNLADGGK